MTLYKAIIENNLSEIKNILNIEPKAINNSEGASYVPFALLSAQYGDIDTVKYIVEYSMASMNIVDNQNRNMLHYGVLSNNIEICKYIVERVGISPLSGDIDLVTPLEIAVNKGYRDIQEYFEAVVGEKYENMYKNPIRKGFFPDPSIVRVGEDYYMVNSSFIYFPCIPISHSKDLINWHIIGHAITNSEWSQLGELEGGRGYWAPDISYYEGKFYITATYRFNDDYDKNKMYRRQIIVSSDKPQGPYSKPIFIDEDGIDPSIFNDDNGRRYMLLNRGARILELNKEATKQISKARLLYYGDNKRASEGPHLLKKGGYYYLFQAEGGTGMGHRISVSRSKELMGKYEPCPYNPILRQNNENEAIQRCGHGKPVMTQKGQWYMVYLCVRALKDKEDVRSILGRETALDPITWTSDGWPIVNNLKGPSCLQIKPSLKEIKVDDCNEFNENLFNTFMFPREPENEGYFIDKGDLILKGSKYDLWDVRARNILLRRQDSFSFEAVCRLEIPDLKESESCGVTCYYDENTYIKFGVENKEGKNIVSVFEKIGERNIAHKGIEVNSNEIYLKVITNNFERKFLYSTDSESYILCCCIDDVNYLCDEGVKIGKRFTGAMVGMYCVGNLSCRFKSFVYK